MGISPLSYSVLPYGDPFPLSLQAGGVSPRTRSVSPYPLTVGVRCCDIVGGSGGQSPLIRCSPGKHKYLIPSHSPSPPHPLPTTNQYHTGYAVGRRN